MPLNPSPVHSVAGIYDTVFSQHTQLFHNIDKQGHSICAVDSLGNSVVSFGSGGGDNMESACTKARSALYWQGFGLSHKSESNPLDPLRMLKYQDIVEYNNFLFNSPHPTRDSLIVHSCKGELLGAIGISISGGGGYKDLVYISKELAKETCKPYMKNYISKNTMK